LGKLQGRSGVLSGVETIIEGRERKAMKFILDSAYCPRISKESVERDLQGPRNPSGCGYREYRLFAEAPNCSWDGDLYAWIVSAETLEDLKSLEDHFGDRTCGLSIIFPSNQEDFGSITVIDGYYCMP